MKNALKKLNLVYKPFIITAITFVPLYTLLNWFLGVQLKLYDIDDVLYTFILPLLLGLIPVIFWLRLKVKALKLKGGNGNLPFLYLFIMTLGLLIPTIISQHYLSSLTGKLTELTTIEDIDHHEATKYYNLRAYYIDKYNVGIKNSFSVNGKRNEDFYMHIDIAFPILESIGDTNQAKAWLGVQYSKRISNHLEDHEKELKYNEFAKECQLDFDTLDPMKFTYLERSKSESLIEAAKESPFFTPDHTTVLFPVHQPFEERNGNKLFWIFTSFILFAIIVLIMILIPKLDSLELKKIESGKKYYDRDLIDFITFIKPRPGYFVTPVIIYLNLLIFLIMAVVGLGFISFQAEDLIHWGANYGPYTINGEWWRLLTSTFLHGGIMHLILNLYGLLFVGMILEPLLGKWTFTWSYLASGIVASIVSLMWHPETVSVGASGAIFGMYGMFLALMLTKIFTPEFSKAFLTSTLIFIGLNLLMGLQGGIDNVAHIGGLISGFVIGLILSFKLKNNSQASI